MAREFLAGIIARSRLGIPAGASAAAAAGDIYRSGNLIAYRDAANGERTLLNAQDNLSNLSSPGTARQNIGAQQAFAGYAVSNWIQPVIGTIGAGNANNVNSIVLYPFVVNRSITVSDLGARVTTAAASAQFQLAIYASSSGLPTGTPLGSTGHIDGSVATHASGLVTPFNLTAGQVHWAAFNCNIAITMQHLLGANSYFGSVFGTPNLNEITATATIVATTRTVSQTYGTWPDLTSATTTVNSGSGSLRGALTYLKVSALL